MTEYEAPQQLYQQPAYNSSQFNQSSQPDEYGDVGRLHECPDCGRKFNDQAIGKHKKICKKVFVEKRKEYNAADHRKATDATGVGI